MRIAGENLKITIDDQIVNYDDNGPVYAPVVLFVHGTPFNKSIWDLQMEALKSNYRVISYDLRGHGDTKGGGAGGSVETYTEDLIRFMDGLELQKVILCGLSLGGYIALNAVDQYPERFNALIVAGVQCMEDDDDVKIERNQMIETLKSGNVEKFADEMMKRLFAPTSFVTRKEEVRAVRRMILSTPVSSMIGSLQALSDRRESCSNLWSFKLPVLLMTGREDEMTPPSAARFMRDNISNSVLHEIEYAGHLANLENTHEFNQLFRAFIDKVCQKKHLSRHCAEETVIRPTRTLAGK